MPLMNYSDIVSNLPLFSGISEEEKKRLLKNGKLRHIASGDYLFHNGDVIHHFYIICTGSVQLLRETPDGKKITTDISTRGRTIGKAEILNTSTHHNVSAFALEDVTLLEFPAKWLKDAASNPVIALNILTSLSQYSHMVEVESEQKTTMSVSQRVGCFLQRICVMHGLDKNSFVLPYSKSLIASRLGMEPETFSRALTKLKEHGISIDDKKIVLRDMQAIEDFICEHCSMLGNCSTHQLLTAENE